MAPIGPLGRILAQVIVPVIAVLARALPAAYSAAVQNAKKNGGAAAKEASNPFAATKMSRAEALQVMNLSEQEATAEVVQKVRGGNFSSHSRSLTGTPLTFFSIYSNTKSTLLQMQWRTEDRFISNLKCIGPRSSWMNSSGKSEWKMHKAYSKKNKTCE